MFNLNTMNPCRSLCFGLALAVAIPLSRAGEAPSSRFGFSGPEVFPIENFITDLHAADIDGGGLTDLIVANNWAAALVIFHAQPDAAILLTRQLFADHPTSQGVIDNHIGALLLNDRVEEAEALLRQIDANRLNPAAKAQHLLSTFEAHVKRGRVREAQTVAAQIPRNGLFPVQVRWLEENLRRLPSTAESKNP